MKGKKKNSNRQLFVLTIIVLLSISYGMYHSFSEKNELNEYPEYTLGKITKKYHITSRGYFIHYNYTVNNKTYNGSQKLTIKEELVKLGDTFKVIYSKKTTDYSKLLIEERIKD